MNLNKKILLLFWCILNASLVFASVYVDNVGYFSHGNVAVVGDGENAEGDVVILDSVTIDGKVLPVVEICCEAFKKNYKITSLKIPNTVQSIKNSAFEFCQNLQYVKLSDSLKTIGRDAFFYCSKLETEIPNGVVDIGEQAFGSCFYLRTSIPNGLTEIKPRVFHHCISMRSITIPANVTKIGKFAFAECLYIDSLIIENKNIEIDEFAFWWDSQIRWLSVPEGTNICGLPIVKSGLVYRIESDTTVSVVSRALRIGGGLEDFNEILSSVTICGKKYTVTKIKKNQYFQLEIDAIDCETPPSVVIPPQADCRELELSFDKDSVHYQLVKGGEVAIRSIKGKDVKYLPLTTVPASVTCGGKKYKIVSLIREKYNYRILNDHEAMIERYKDTVDDVVIPSTVTYRNKVYTIVAIGDNAFDGRDIKSVVIPDGVKEIGSYAFYGCRFSSVNLPSSVEKIGASAFKACRLRSIIIPENVKRIGNWAFEFSMLDTVIILSKNVKVGYAAFQYCDSISYIDFPENVDIHEAELTFEKDKIRYQVLNGDTVLVVKNENKKTPPNMISLGNKEFYVKRYPDPVIIRY